MPDYIRKARPSKQTRPKQSLTHDAERLRQNAVGTSAAQWAQDMAWLYDQHDPMSLTDEKVSVLCERWRASHRQMWGVYACTPD